MSLELSKLERKAVTKTKVLGDIVTTDGKVTIGESLYFQQLQKI